MIDLNPPLKVRNRYVTNILDTYRAAEPRVRKLGAAWYPVAHDLAGMIGNGDVRMGAGIIAALSANKGWLDNVRLAKDAAVGNLHGHTKDNLVKTERIMTGEDPLMVLPAGLKTGHFFRCILDPTDPTSVVVDRHAHDVAVGQVYGQEDRGLRTLLRYELIADAYRTAAKRLKVVPSTVQATVWIAHREMLSGVGHRRTLVDGAS